MADEAQVKGWLKPVIAGSVMAVLCHSVIGWSTLGSIVAGVVVGGVAHLVLGRKADVTASATGAAPVSVPTPPPAATSVAPEPAAVPVSKEAASSEVAVAESAVMKPSTPLPGEAELAGRKGEWRYEATEADVAETAAQPAPVAAPPVAEAALIKPSTPLAGEAELAARKGTWTYSPGSA